MTLHTIQTMIRVFFLLLIMSNAVFGKSQEMRLFYLYPIDAEYPQKGAFVSLSDERIWMNEEFADAAYNPYNMDEGKAREDSIVLGQEREDFLRAARVKDTDKLHIYSMFLDSVLTFEPTELALIKQTHAHWGVDIGFKLTAVNLEKMGDFYWNAFAYIGPSNPFQTGTIHPMVWKQTEKAVFPKNVEIPSQTPSIVQLSAGEVFECVTEDYTYLVQDLIDSTSSRIRGRHLVVFESESDTLIFNKVFFNTESKSLTPLTGEGENIQWTGQPFQHKPLMVYGFVWVSFGCPAIDFIGLENQSVEILCNNRH